MTTSVINSTIHLFLLVSLFIGDQNVNTSSPGKVHSKQNNVLFRIWCWLNWWDLTLLLLWTKKYSFLMIKKRYWHALLFLFSYLHFHFSLSNPKSYNAFYLLFHFFDPYKKITQNLIELCVFSFSSLYYLVDFAQCFHFIAQNAKRKHSDVRWTEGRWLKNEKVGEGETVLQSTGFGSYFLIKYLFKGFFLFWSLWFGGGTDNIRVSVIKKLSVQISLLK